MYGIKTKAEQIRFLLGKSIYIPALLCAAARLSAWLCFSYANRCAGFVTKTHPLQADIPPASLLPACVLKNASPLLFGAGVLFLLFWCEGKAAFLSLFYHAANGERKRYRELLSVRQGLRYGLLRGTVTLCRLRDLLERFSPALVLSLGVIAKLAFGGIPNTLLIAAGAILAIQIPVCTFCFFADSDRYILAEYLLWRHPLLSAKEAVHSSRLLCVSQKKLLRRLRLAAAPWKLVSAVGVPMLFTVSYLPAVKTAAACRIYGDDTTVFQ